MNKLISHAGHCSPRHITMHPFEFLRKVLCRFSYNFDISNDCILDKLIIFKLCSGKITSILLDFGNSLKYMFDIGSIVFQAE